MSKPKPYLRCRWSDGNTMPTNTPFTHLMMGIYLIIISVNSIRGFPWDIPHQRQNKDESNQKCRNQKNKTPTEAPSKEQTIRLYPSNQYHVDCCQISGNGVRNRHYNLFVELLGLILVLHFIVLWGLEIGLF